MKFFNWKTILAATALFLGSMWVLQLFQTPDSILQDVLVYEEGKHNVLQIKLNIPVRYENHFPTNKTDFVQIKLRAVSLSGVEKNEYVGSEAILPGFLEQVPVSDIAYEGDVPNGPFISVRFREPVVFQVKEDPALKGVMLLFAKK